MTSRDFWRCPAAQMRMASPSVAIPAPARTVALVGLASQNANTPNRNPKVTRQRDSRNAVSDMVGACRRDDARLPRAFRRRVCPPDTSAPACNGAGDDTHRPRRAETVTSSGNQGPFLDGRVGPKMPTTGVPTAAATCAGPVSPGHDEFGPADRATRSLIDAGGATIAAPEE